MINGSVHACARACASLRACTHAYHATGMQDACYLLYNVMCNVEAMV